MEREPSASEAAPAAAALFAWGANSYGQLGLGHKEDVLLPQQLNDFCKPRSVRRITGGGGHSAVVTDGGDLFVCGLNKDGQLGLGHTEDIPYFTPCKSLFGCPIQQVACGWDFTIMLTENGQVLSCGSNSFGQLGVPHGPRRCVVPQAIEFHKEKVVCIAAGLRHALAATASGIVFQWGTGLAPCGRRLCPGQTLPLFFTAKEPSRVTGLENSKAMCVLAGSDHSASLTETGKMFTWGRADYGQLGRKLETYEGWKLEKQDSFLPCSRPPNSMPSSPHCLTGATEVECVTLGAGMSMACAEMALKPTSGPQSRCRLCCHRQDSLWAVGLATPWPSASCQLTLHWSRTPGSPTFPQMPSRTLNLRKPWTKRETGRKDNQKLQPKANLTGPEMGDCDRESLIKWLFPPKAFPENCFVGLWGWPKKGSGGSDG
ncbi:secretion-regulating guanine nucleotide exchange factor isoform X3 [Pan troglodytes]|uniref:secretion-regulating guanine nucleotide exchange factor isoform X3 n=1 Tax=Pan troglodytes TaxID=9598 RepID=UPI0023F33F66|nr:secretion-regulating guanine nucleotide exchange factor isoform X5 [Pan troglodytes]